MFANDEKTGVYPVYVTAARNRLHHINLLLLKEESASHYSWIKDMSRLLYHPGQHKGQKRTFVSTVCTGFARRRVGQTRGAL